MECQKLLCDRVLQIIVVKGENILARAYKILFDDNKVFRNVEVGSVAGNGGG
jgi:hypothetical protein